MKWQQAQKRARAQNEQSRSNWANLINWKQHLLSLVSNSFYSLPRKQSQQ